MNIGIYINSCNYVDLSNNKFHNIDRPVVANGVKNLRATGNIATYGKNEGRVYGVGGNAFHPLLVAIWSTYLE